MATLLVDWGDSERALVEAGAAKVCKEHFDVLLRVDDNDDAMRHAYAIGTNMVKYGRIRETSRPAFMAEIAYTHASLDDICYICRAAGQVK